MGNFQSECVNQVSDPPVNIYKFSQNLQANTQLNALKSSFSEATGADSLFHKKVPPTHFPGDLCVFYTHNHNAGDDTCSEETYPGIRDCNGHCSVAPFNMVCISLNYLLYMYVSSYIYYV